MTRCAVTVPDIRHQMDVYFDAFPTINTDVLAARVAALDPDEKDNLQVTTGNADEMGTPPGLPADTRTELYHMSLGDYNGIMLVHGCPSPAGGIIQGSPLGAEVKSGLSAHKAFAFVTIMGGSDYPPFEAEILLRKIGTALCEQGATGIGFPETGLVFPGGLLTQLTGAGGGDGTIWQALRQDGEPLMFMGGIGPYAANGKRWLVTRGFAHCGFPDM